jgi:hypothetical protein
LSRRSAVYTIFIVYPLIMCLLTAWTATRGLGTAVWNHLQTINGCSRTGISGCPCGIRWSARFAFHFVMPLSSCMHLAQQADPAQHGVQDHHLCVLCDPRVLCGLLWSFILKPNNGLINSVFRLIGLDALCLDWIGGRGF